MIPLFVICGVILAANCAVLVVGLARIASRYLSSREAGQPAIATDVRSAPSAIGTGRHEAPPEGPAHSTSGGASTIEGGQR